VAARKRVHAAALRHGKFPAVASLFGQREQLVEEGVRVFTLGADVLELGSAFHRLVKDFSGTASAAASDSPYQSK
jgi:4-hydroxy-2-oxoheptanedioate aldolase